MGVERAVTRWYLQHQSILNEIAALEAKLAQVQTEKPDNTPEQVDIEQQLTSAQTRLRTLGPCPKPMMG